VLHKCSQKIPCLLFRENWRKTREYSLGEGEGEDAGAGREVDGGEVRGDHQVVGRQSDRGEGGVRGEAEGAGGRVTQQILVISFSHIMLAEILIRKYLM
jgi:hypothetical protein